MLHATSRGENAPLQHGKKEKIKLAARAYVLNIFFPSLSPSSNVFSLFWIRGEESWKGARMGEGAGVEAAWRRLHHYPAGIKFCLRLQSVCWSGTADGLGRRSGGAQVLPGASSVPVSCRSPAPRRSVRLMRYAPQLRTLPPVCRPPREGWNGRVFPWV